MRAHTRALLFALLVPLTRSASSVASPPPPSTGVAELVYDGGLKPGWQDWGWGAHDLSSGAAKINLSNYGGWIVHKDGLGSRFGALVFRMQAPSSFGDFLQIKLGYQKDDASYPTIDVGSDRIRPLKDGWVEVNVPWNSLDPAGAPVDRIMIHAKSVVGADWVRFDKIYLTRFDPKAVAAALARAPKRTVKLEVDCKAPDHTISPYIYGVAGGGDLSELGATARRWGGNPTSRYNFLVNALNVGKDWYFENTSSGDYRSFLEEDRKHGMASALTIPMIGWIAKDKTSSGFPVSKLGPQQSTDQWRPDAGNGIGKDGKPIRPGPPTETSVAAPPSLMRAWVQKIVKDDQQSGARSVQMYILDNEPNLWNSTHRDVHPNPLTYDELLDRTIKYGSAIREADPKAVIAGPAEWGWTAYLYSAADAEAGVQNAPDRRAHGDQPLVAWYLKKLHDYEVSKGVKILDVLDLHFYPQAANVFGGGGTDPNTAALRIRSTRALWDLTYPDESWIHDAVRLIPRMKQWIAQNYPGLKTSIGEYNFGGEHHMSGALALAEALGRFGTEGLDYAFYWTFPPKDSPAFWAFRAFRNFDSQGGHFLDRSLSARGGSDVSIFASRDESGKHLVVITLNFDPAKAADAHIALHECGAVASRRKFTYGPHVESMSDDGTKTTSSLDEFLPPYSINVFDVMLK